MVILYSNNETEKICNDEHYASKYFMPSVVSKLKTLLYRLQLYPSFSAMYEPMNKKRFDTHPLKGDKKELISLSLDYKQRVTVKLKKEKSDDGQDILTIMEVSNHYGD